MLSLDSLQVRDIEASFMGRRYQFALFNIDGRSAVTIWWIIFVYIILIVA